MDESMLLFGSGVSLRQRDSQDVADTLRTAAEDTEHKVLDRLPIASHFWGAPTVVSITPDLSIELVAPIRRRRHSENTGTALWTAGKQLARWLARDDSGTDCSPRLQPPRLERRRVVELGAGLGLPGIVAACLGATVVLTDLAENIPTLQENILRNAAKVSLRGGQAVAHILDWEIANADMRRVSGRTKATSVLALDLVPVDVLIGADITWNEDDGPLLLSAILAVANMCSDDTPLEIILAHTPREPSVLFESFPEFPFAKAFCPWLSVVDGGYADDRFTQIFRLKVVR